MSLRGERRFTGVPILVLAPVAVLLAAVLQFLPVRRRLDRRAAQALDLLGRDRDSAASPTGDSSEPSSVR